MRTVLVIVCLLAALLCGYGFITTLEPGVSVGWKVGYGAGAAAFLLLAAITAIRRKGSLPR
jgi:hypothetical protein